jgi:hypothetical protein
MVLSITCGLIDTYADGSCPITPLPSCSAAAAGRQSSLLSAALHMLWLEKGRRPLGLPSPRMAGRVQQVSIVLMSLITLSLSHTILVRELEPLGMFVKTRSR